MAFETFTAVLNSAEFPFISDFLQRTITIPGIDGPPRVPRPEVGSEEASNYQFAKHFYCQNVMPTVEGLMSVGYSQLVPALAPSTDFDIQITLRDEDENNFLFCPARGKNYIYKASDGVWVPRNSFTGWLGEIVSHSYVNGRTFVCYERHNVFEFDTGADTFLPVILTGINPNDIDCIGASNNYNIAVTGITVNWSSLVDPLDFTPSIQTGAGNAIPQDMKGIGRAVVPISGGFVIYTTKNAVAALYTNNARAPFVFREISNAGGITSPQHVSLEASLGFHYAWTTNGLQKITVNSAETLSAGATDFLAGRILETFDIPSLTLTLERLNTDLEVHLTYVAGRYLVISYGKVVNAPPQTFTHALIFDTALKRWGKLRIDHVDCFAYPYPNLPNQVIQSPPKQSVAFLQRDGRVMLLVMDYRIRQNEGVLLLGKYQLVRQKMATFQKLELEGLQTAYPPDVYLILSTDGKTQGTPQQLQLLADAGNFKTYGAPTVTAAGGAPQRTGKNFSILATGTFELSTAVLTLTKHGNR